MVRAILFASCVTALFAQLEDSKAFREERLSHVETKHDARCLVQRLPCDQLQRSVQKAQHYANRALHRLPAASGLLLLQGDCDQLRRQGELFIELFGSRCAAIRQREVIGS